MLSLVTIFSFPVGFRYDLFSLVFIADKQFPLMYVYVNNALTTFCNYQDAVISHYSDGNDVV